MTTISPPPRVPVSETTAWKEHTFRLDGSEKHILLHEAEEGCFTINKDIKIVVSKHNKPAFHLHLILNRLPRPEEKNVVDFMERAVLTFSVYIGITEQDLKLPEISSLNCKPLYAQEIMYTLKSADEEYVLAKADSSGIQGRAQLVTHLNQQQALEVMGALEGNSTTLVLEAEIKYQSQSKRQNLRIYGNWSEIYFALKARSEDGIIKATVIKDSLLALLKENILQIEALEFDEMDEELLWTVYQQFMRLSSIIFYKQDAVDRDESFVFKAPPHKAFYLDFAFSFNKTTFKTLKLETNLQSIFGGLTNLSNWNELVQLSAYEKDSAIVRDVPERVTTRSINNSSRFFTENQPYVYRNNSIQSLSLAAADVDGQEKRSVKSAMLKPAAVSGVTEIKGINEAVVEGWGDKATSLPVVHEYIEPIWKDRIDQNLFWFAPELKVRVPDQNVSHTNSPFLFTFERIGTTGSGAPALKGNLKLTFQIEMLEETKKLLRTQNLKVQQIRLEDISIVLRIPFVDNTGRLRFNEFHTKGKQNGNEVMAEIPLLNEWVQLTYGALAKEGFQSEAPQVKWVYVFKAFSEIYKQQINVNYGGKLSHIPIVYAEEITKRPQTYLDATSLTVKSPTSEIRFKKEQPQFFRDSQAIDRSLKPSMIKPIPIYPQVEYTQQVITALDKARYLQRGIVQRGTQKLHFSCEKLGHLYREIKDKESVAVGCTEISKLGKIEYKQYKEIAELRHQAYRVYQSLQQPGKFLVVPSRFVIRRRQEFETIKPAVFLYSTLDATNPNNSSINFFASLQPDIPVYERALLQSKLTRFSPVQEIFYPTDIPTSSIEANWLLDKSITTAQNIDTVHFGGPFISINFTVDIARWPLMQNMLIKGGISGSISFKLPDDTLLNVDILLQLTTIRGPWMTGPVRIEKSNNKVKVINKINQPLELSEIYRISGSNIERSPVPIFLGADQEKETTVAWNNGTFIPVYHYLPADPISIEESRSYIEDIFQNVAFVNLVPLNEIGLERIEIQCRMKGMAQIYRSQVTEGMPVVEVQLILSLTTYIQNKTLEIRFTRKGKDKRDFTTSWKDWNLKNDGTTISITSALLEI
jgi:hypothetical protein